jgi:hypothetical protein
MRAIDEPVLDLTGDEPGDVPEPLLDLTTDAPEASPEVVDYAGDDLVLDLTGDEPGHVPEPLLDLTSDAPETSPDAVDRASDDLVLDLTEDAQQLALPDLVQTPVAAEDRDTQAFLFETYDRLTSDEQAALVREADTGDRLAQHLVDVLDAAGAELCPARERRSAEG